MTPVEMDVALLLEEEEKKYKAKKRAEQDHTKQNTQPAQYPSSNSSNKDAVVTDSPHGDGLGDPAFPRALQRTVTIDTGRPGSRNGNSHLDKNASHRPGSRSGPALRDQDSHNAEGQRFSSDRSSANGSVTIRSRSRSRSPRRPAHYPSRRKRSPSPPERRGHIDRYSSGNDRYTDRYSYDRQDYRRRDYDRHYREGPAEDYASNERHDARNSYDRDRDRGRDNDDFSRRPARRPYDGGRPRHDDRARQSRDADLDSGNVEGTTVFCQQIAAALKEEQLEKFFANRGCKDPRATIVKDKVSGRSKGIAYVSFADEESVEKALKLTGHKLLGVPIIVQLTEAEKNRQSRATAAASQGNGVFHRLYVGNIHFSVTESELKGIFAPYGDLEFVQLQKDENGRSKGYGFVQFTDPDDAKNALDRMNGFNLCDRAIRVGLGNDRHSTELQNMTTRPGQDSQLQLQGSSFSGAGGRGQHAGGTGTFDRTASRDNDRVGGASALDDNDVGSSRFNNISRSNLMGKLRRDQPAETQKTIKKSTAPAYNQTAVTRGICVKQMFAEKDKFHEHDGSPKADWQKQIIEDVEPELQKAYGPPVFTAVDPSSEEGEVYIKFASTENAKRAWQGLNGRKFDGRILTASYVVDFVFNTMWPKSANL